MGSNLQNSIEIFLPAGKIGSMARQLRILFQSAFYHVTSRGNLRNPVFFAASDRKKFLEILRRTKEKYSYLLHGYALMDNHYHLLIETPRANLSRIMQTINTSYTVYINLRYQRSGHLFQGRFKAILVDKDEYLLQLSRYIHLNPVRAEVVEKPEDYPWTSYHLFLGEKKDPLVDTSEILFLFGRNDKRARRSYRAFVEGTVNAENPLRNLTKGILGDEQFVEKVRPHVNPSSMGEEIPRTQRPTKEIPVENVVGRVAALYGKDKEMIFRRGKGKPEREAAVYVAKAATGKTNGEIGVYFGIKGSAVSEIIKRVERRFDQDVRFRQKIGALKDRLQK